MDQKPPIIDAKFDEKSKTGLRMKYEAEVGAIINRIGDLETVRLNLGLSRRKICQLLMVDPSAWTRWSKPLNQAPPHVYRALEWYLALNEKYPQMGNAFWLSFANSSSHFNGVNTSRMEEELKIEIKEAVSRELFSAKNELQKDVSDRIDRNFYWLKTEFSKQDKKAKKRKHPLPGVLILVLGVSLGLFMGLIFSKLT